LSRIPSQLKKVRSFARLSLVASVLVLGVTQGGAAAQSPYRVNDTAPGVIQDGQSWSTAFLTLQQAITAANQNYDQIWVAEGTYKAGVSPADTHLIPDTVDVYGGFDATENFFSQRAGLFEQTILTGDLDGSASKSIADSFHIITLQNNGTNIIDGFRIEYGNAFASASVQSGGGILIPDENELTLRNCIIRKCYAESEGAGVYGCRAAISMSYCTIRDNRSKGHGGGVRLADSYGDIFNVLFAGNRSDAGGGGLNADILSLTSPGLTICNSLFRGNSSNLGGGLYVGLIGDRFAIVVNCTFAGNETFEDATGSGSEGAAIYLQDANTDYAQVYNSILWDNISMQGGRAVIDTIGGPGTSLVTVEYSDTQTLTPWSGPGNINVDPLFVSPSTSEYRLQAGSPCIDVGDNGRLPLDPLDLDDDTDLGEEVPYELIRGLPRRVDDPAALGTGAPVNDDPYTDMGCYEKQVGTPG